MIKLSILAGLLLVPASGWAQRFSAEYDPEPIAVEAPAVAQPTQPAQDSAVAARPRAVRYAQGAVRMVNGTSPMSAELDMRRLPANGR
ncbi:hypothetical protein ASE00_12435 [Sphingomonas sp. Root710]|uniref:hypothetical protein n=1 Tax=Sphingomonas sp. Root710 TaxID=1736594 RepID=UPI0006F664E7|nr:hypothetical protein [Sphingomonas sp. Root710]KRB82822.1 hypothetical protein ASE00_12435 [Sphingomonas sp. Root710]